MKKAVTLLLVLILAINVFPFAVSASENIYVTVDGATLKFDQPPIMQNDRVLVPMRLIFETLGATVEWDEYNQYVKATKEDISIAMQIGNNTMVKNGQYITLDTAPILLNGRTLVPVRAVAESLEATVEWRGEINTVVIEQKVIQKRYATETLLYAPSFVTHITTDTHNNIYYIDSINNKIMEYKDNLTRVVSDISTEYARFAVSDEIYNTDISESGFVPYDSGRGYFFNGIVSFLLFDDRNNRLLAGIACQDGLGYAAMAIADITNNKILAGKKLGGYWQDFEAEITGYLKAIQDNKIYFSRETDFYQVDLSTGRFTEYPCPPYSMISTFTLIDNKMTNIAIEPSDAYKLYQFQYNPQKDDYDYSIIKSKDNNPYNVSYIGTDGFNFYYIENSNIYRISVDKQVKLWVSAEEIDFQDQIPLSGTVEGWPQLTFDREGNILFYDINVLSIRRIKKLN